MLETKIEVLTKSLDRLSNIINGLYAMLLTQHDRLTVLEAATPAPILAMARAETAPSIEAKTAPSIEAKTTTAPEAMTKEQFADQVKAFAKEYGKEHARSVLNNGDLKTLGDYQTQAQFDLVLAKMAAV